MKDNFEFGSTWDFEGLFLQLASTLKQLAKTRLTEKQRFLLFAAHRALRFHPNLSPTALADFLARKFKFPLSTTKFNLNILRNAGLLEIRSSNSRGTRICLSYGGQLLTQLLPEPD
ncbi:MAG: hypothetical protein ACFE9O_07670 [Promethearchaeota archaeon]